MGPSKGIKEGIEQGVGVREEVVVVMLLPKHIDNGFSVYLFLEFEPWLDKSGEFNNQGIKEN